jgi:chromosome partitioning protein
MEDVPEKFALANRSRLDLLIIDTPPAIGAHTLAAIGLADFVLLPMRPTMFDLRATRHWINLLRSAAQSFGVVINAAPPRREGLDAPMVRDARAALHSLGVNAWRSQITHRHVIPQSCIGGRGVAETDPTGPAAIEYAELWRLIHRAIEHIRRTHHEKSSAYVA